MKLTHKTFQSRVASWGFLLWMGVAGLLAIQSLSGAEPDAAYVAISTNNVDIPPGQLLWLVKPLTKEELIVEADAWQDLLKEIARKISAAEIEVLRRNQQIQKSEEAAEATRAAQEASEKATELTKKAEAEGTAEAGMAAAEVAEEAQEQVKKAQEALDEVKKSEEEDEVAKTANQVVDEVNAQKPDSPGDDESSADDSSAAEAAASIEVMDVDINAVSDSTNLATAARTAELKAEATAEAKTELLETLTELRTRRAGVIERFNVVLRELKLKGADTEGYENYRKSVDEVIVDVSDTSAVWTFITGWLTSEKGGVKWGVNASKFVSIMVVFYGLALLVGKLVQKATGRARTMSTLLKDFINMFVRRIIIAIGLLIAVSSIGIAITPLLAVITAAGLVVGLALQGTLSNFASGLLLLFYRPFDVGDAIDAGGTAGTVDSMNLMSTIVRTWDNKVMIVPNNSIWGNTITNISRTNRRRVDMVFGIGYSDSMEQAQTILEKIVKDHPNTLNDPAPVVRVHELGDSSVNFIVRPWVLPADYWEVYWSITRKVKEEFDAQGVSIPFPQRDVHFYRENDGDGANDALNSESGGRPEGKSKGRAVAALPKQNQLEDDDED